MEQKANGIYYAYLVFGIVFVLIFIWNLVSGKYLPSILFLLASIYLFYRSFLLKKLMEVQAKRVNDYLDKQANTSQKINDEKLIEKINIDPYDPVNIKVQDLRKGYFVDLKADSYEVKELDKIYWTEGDEETLSQVSKHIKIESKNDHWYLRVFQNKSNTDIALCKAINAYQIDKYMDQYAEGDDFKAPSVFKYNGEEYFRNSRKRGIFIDPTDMTYRAFINWDYYNNDRNQYLSIDYWGEKQFNAYYGSIEEPNTFSDILPSNASE